MKKLILFFVIAMSLLQSCTEPGNEFLSNGKSLSLTIKDLNENQILLSEVFEINPNKNHQRIQSTYEIILENDSDIVLGELKSQEYDELSAVQDAMEGFKENAIAIEEHLGEKALWDLVLENQMEISKRF